MQDLLTESFYDVFFFLHGRDFPDWTSSVTSIQQQVGLKTLNESLTEIQHSQRLWLRWTMMPLAPNILFGMR